MDVSAEQVRSEVQRFWGAFMAKSAEAIESFYLPESTVFSSVASRAEPGRLAATRRKREYFHPESRIRVQLGPIEVQAVGDIAVASYTFEFHASRVAGALGKTVEEDIQNGRATQVFAQQPDGKLCILHEHLSYVPKS